MGARKLSIKLTKEQQQQVRDRLLLVNHHKQVAAQLERELHQFLKLSLGVDVESENWSLDIDAGRLNRVPTSS